MSGQSDYTWSTDPYDNRNLDETSDYYGRIAGTWYTQTSETFNVNLMYNVASKVSFYVLDWDSQGRSEDFDITDADTGALLDTETVSNFQNGEYLSWNLQGNVNVTVTNLDPDANAVVSGVFFDPVVPTWVNASGTNFSAQAGSAFSGQVANFTAPVSDQPQLFSAWINWGDGGGSPGTIVPDGNGYDVDGSYTYWTSGGYGTDVTITSFDAATSDGWGNANVYYGLSINNVAPLNTVSGADSPNIVAQFTDPNTDDPNQMSATITWDDGSTTPGTIVSDPWGDWDVVVPGGPPFSAPSTHAYYVAISDSYGASASTSAYETWTLSPIAADAGVDTYYQTGTASNSQMPWGGSVTIDWGDGSTPTQGSVGENSDGSMSIYGDHQYSASGVFTITSTVIPYYYYYLPPVTTSAQVSVADVPQNAQGSNDILATAYADQTLTLATFAGAYPADFSATITWGDGGTSLGTVAAGNGVLTVSGDHTYYWAAPFSYSVQITDQVGNTTSAGGTINVTTYGATPLAISEFEGATFNDPVASVPDPGPGGTATIDWGDGDTSSGSLTADPNNPGYVLVSAPYSYAALGTYLVSVQVFSYWNQTIDVYTTATVADPPITASTSGIVAFNGQTFDGVAAAFSNGDPAASAANFTALIDWGPYYAWGTISSDGQGGFLVSGAYNFGQDGIYNYARLDLGSGRQHCHSLGDSRRPDRNADREYRGEPVPGDRRPSAGPRARRHRRGLLGDGPPPMGSSPPTPPTRVTCSSRRCMLTSRRARTV